MNQKFGEMTHDIRPDFFHNGIRELTYGSCQACVPLVILLQESPELSPDHHLPPISPLHLPRQIGTRSLVFLTVCHALIFVYKALAGLVMYLKLTLDFFLPLEEFFFFNIKQRTCSINEVSQEQLTTRECRSRACLTEHT